MDLRLRVVLCLVFLSGAASLLFETLWFRQAGLMFGSSVWASSLVTASFMGGLALGNGLAGRLGGRPSRPVRAYALLELAIGATGIGLVLLFPRLTPLLAAAFRPLLPHPAALNALRLVLAFSLMLVPATAMGATLPVLVRALTAAEPHFGRALGRLYGWNTLGAVAGALAGEGLLVARLGLTGTGLVAAACNTAIAAVALALSRSLPSLSAEPDGVAQPGISRTASRLLGAAFLSGGLLLALEVVWLRFLLLFVFGSSLTFAMLLAVILAGIGVGGLTAAAWLRRRPGAPRLLPVVALGSGLATAATYATFARVLQSQGEVFLVRPLAILEVSAALMLPTALLSGLLFTLLGQALKAAVPGDARAAGSLTLANTAGAMTGALLGGFVLLPALGMERSLFALACGYGGVALLTLGEGSQRSRREAGVLLGAAVSAGAVLALFPFGLLRNHYLPKVASSWARDGSRIVAVREGLTETLVYLRRELFGETVYHRLLANGITMSSSHFGSRRYMNLFVYWPVAVHPRPRRALLISYGVGSTAMALTDTAELESIDVVDISRDILAGSRIVFPPPARHPLDDPRVQVHVEDGRFFLLTTDRSYDLITGEPPPPKNAGIVSLYSREYFHLLRGRLAEGGIATYWLPVNQLELEDGLGIIRAFCDAFDDCSLWSGFGPEWMLVGTRGARGPADEERFSRQWRDPAVRPTLLDLGLETPEQMGALFIAGAEDLARLYGGVPPVDDDHPQRVSRRLPRRTSPRFMAFADALQARERFERSALVRRLWPESLRARSLAQFETQAIIDRFCWATRGEARVGLPEAWSLLSRSSLRVPALWVLGGSAEEERIARRARGRGVRDPHVDELLGLAALADRDYVGAEAHFREAQPLLPDPGRLAQLRVMALCLAGNHRGAQAVLAGSPPPIRFGDPTTWAWLSRTCAPADPSAPSAAPQD